MVGNPIKYFYPVLDTVKDMARTIKIDYLDQLFSDYIRERAGWRCERCGSILRDIIRIALHQSNKLYCHHFHRRHKKSVRWHPDNGICVCFGCHAWFHQNPIEEVEFFRKRLGDDKFDALTREANRTWPKPDKAAITLYLKQELKKIKDH